MSLVKLLLSEGSAEEINLYLERNGLSRRRNLHSTLIYTCETLVPLSDFAKEVVSQFTSMSLDPRSYSFDIFERNLVLRYENEEVLKMYWKIVYDAARLMMKEYYRVKKWNKFMREHGYWRETWGLQPKIYSEFNPHITLVKNYSGSPASLDLPEFPIVFDRMSWFEGNKNS